MLFLVCRKGRNAVVAVIVLLLLSLDMVYKLLSCAWFIRKNAEMLLLLLVLLCLYCGWSPENCHVVLAVNILDVVLVWALLLIVVRGWCLLTVQSFSLCSWCWCSCYCCCCSCPCPCSCPCCCCCVHIVCSL